MLVKANVSFAGEVSMYKGEERNIESANVLSDLLKAGYVTEANETEKNKKKVVKK